MSEPQYEASYAWPTREINRYTFLRLLEQTVKRLSRLEVAERPKEYRAELFIDIAQFRVLSAQQLADVFGVSRQSIYNWLKICDLNPPPTSFTGRGSFYPGAVSIFTEIVRQRALGQTPPEELKLKMIKYADNSAIRLLTGYTISYLRAYRDQVEDTETRKELKAWTFS